MRNLSIARFSWRLGLGLATAALLLPSPTQASPAHVTLADLGGMIAKSLVGVTSFQVVIDTSGAATGAKVPSSKERITEYLVRRGDGFQMYAQMTINGKASTMVDTGKHPCMRMSNSSAWNCTYPTSLATSFVSSIDIVKAFKSSGTIMQNIMDAGTKTVQGQSCRGYTFTAITKLIHFTGHGTYWFSASTGRVVEMTEIGSLLVTSGTPAMATATTVVYSRWNDPNIKLPAVPAS